MWCTVHVLYSDGARIAPEAAKADRRYGWLRMHSKSPKTGDADCRAYLLPTTYAPLAHSILSPLERCSLRAIDGGGIRLTGVEGYVDGGTLYHQSWWIIPGELK